jgi:GntR family transcriptional regulator
MSKPASPQGITPARLNPELPTPLYHQLYVILRSRISRGEYPPNAVLPGEQELARSFDVSRITVKRSLNELAAHGLVSRHRGRGTIVAPRRAIPLVVGSFDTLMDSLRSMGVETELRLIHVAEVRADERVAELLELPRSAPVQRAVRVRSIAGEPFSHLVTFVPAQIARRFAEAELVVTPLLVLLERAGATVESAEQWISAAAAEPEIADHLDIPAGSPVLRIERIMREAKRAPVELLQAHYHPDRFQYHVKSARKRSARAGRRRTRAQIDS